MIGHLHSSPSKDRVTYFITELYHILITYSDKNISPQEPDGHIFIQTATRWFKVKVKVKNHFIVIITWV